jgi:hypothetical protein
MLQALGCSKVITALRSWFDVPVSVSVLVIVVVLEAVELWEIYFRLIQKLVIRC